MHFSLVHSFISLTLWLCLSSLFSAPFTLALTILSAVLSLLKAVIIIFTPPLPFNWIKRRVKKKKKKKTLCVVHVNVYLSVCFGVNCSLALMEMLKLGDPGFDSIGYIVSVQLKADTVTTCWCFCSLSLKKLFSACLFYSKSFVCHILLCFCSTFFATRLLIMTSPDESSISPSWAAN